MIVSALIESATSSTAICTVPRILSTTATI